VKEGNKWKGIRVMVQLKCQNRAAEITINPSSSALLIKELGNYERDRKKVKNVNHKGNLTFEQIKKVAKVIEEKSMAKSFAGTVKQVLGTCLSLGCTVDKQSPKQVIAKINNGELKVWFYLNSPIQIIIKSFILIWGSLASLIKTLFQVFQGIFWERYFWISTLSHHWHPLILPKDLPNQLIIDPIYCL